MPPTAEITRLTSKSTLRTAALQFIDWLLLVNFEIVATRKTSPLSDNQLAITNFLHHTTARLSKLITVINKSCQVMEMRNYAAHISKIDTIHR